jgi:MSHA biogenesis protein MshG
MPRFQYQARSSGQLIEGALEAPDAQRVADLLGERGASPLKIALLAADEPSGRAAPGFGWPRRKVAIDELILFSRQMRSLARAGIPVLRALRGLTESTSNPSLAAALKETVDSLEAGADLATSLARHPQVFSDIYVSVIHVGENTGRLDEAFAQIGEYLEFERDTRRSLQAASRYPMFVLLAISAALVIVNIYVIPAFDKVFAKYGAALPWQTRALIATSDFFVAWWPALLMLGVLGTFAVRGWVGTPAGRLWWDRVRLRLPIVGGLFQRIGLARFCQTFAMVLRAGVPLLQGLAVVGHAIGNQYMAERIRDMRTGIERGESITRTAAASGLFTPIVLQMLSVGEETGRVDELLAECARFYSEEVEYLLKGLAEAIEPILIIAIGGLVLVLALGVFLPLWDLSSVALK